MTVTLLTVGSIGTNCYLLGDETSGAGAVVDPGGGAGQVLSAIAQSGLRICAIFLTHGHFDHTGAVKKLRAELPGVPVYLHPADKALLGSAIMPAIGETIDYGEGDHLSVGALDVTVLHTPGHTPGGVCLLVGNSLFCGDTLFQGSMGRTDLAGGDEAALMASLRRLAQLPGDLTVLPGHMETSTLAAEWQYNPCLREAMRR